MLLVKRVPYHLGHNCLDISFVELEEFKKQEVLRTARARSVKAGFTLVKDTLPVGKGRIKENLLNWFKRSNTESHREQASIAANESKRVT